MVIIAGNNDTVLRRIMRPHSATVCLGDIMRNYRVCYTWPGASTTHSSDWYIINYILKNQFQKKCNFLDWWKQYEWLRILKNEENNMNIDLPLSKHESQRAASLASLKASQALEHAWLSGKTGIYVPNPLFFSGHCRVGMATSLPGNTHFTAFCFAGGSEGDWEAPKSYTESSLLRHVLFHFLSLPPNLRESIKELNASRHWV